MLDSMFQRITLLTLLAVVLLAADPAQGQEPGWKGTIVAVGAERTKIQSTEIRKRPYRPFHIYGNTVRRLHYRRQPLPLPRDLFQGLDALVRR
jgi:hypothetical protein